MMTPTVNRYATLATLCSLISCLSGCFSTQLPPATVSSEQIPRLQALADQDLALTLRANNAGSGVIGYQYILFGLPVSRVYAPRLVQDLAHALSLEAALRNRHLRSLPASQFASPQLSVTLTDITVSGYDYLFLRRPSARVALSATLSSPSRPTVTCTAIGETTRTARFAFGPELVEVLRESIEASSDQLLTCLLGERVIGRSNTDPEDNSHAASS